MPPSPDIHHFRVYVMSLCLIIGYVKYLGGGPLPLCLYSVSPQTFTHGFWNHPCILPGNIITFLSNGVLKIIPSTISALIGIIL